MKTIIAMTAAALLASVAGHASAQPSDRSSDTGLPTATVSYADLDLGSIKGRHVLEQRVEAAITRVCPARPMPVEVWKQPAFEACHKAAMASAKQQMASVYGGRLLADAGVSITGMKH